jgi:hypothetical protein
MRKFVAIASTRMLLSLDRLVAGPAPEVMREGLLTGHAETACSVCRATCVSRAWIRAETDGTMPGQFEHLGS